MSKTVSFRASEELDEFLEREAERRMTTKSTVAQMLVAERARQSQLGHMGEEDSIVPENPAPDRVELANSDSEDRPAIFDRYSDKWHVPDSSEGNKFAVRTTDGRLVYYKTQKHAARRLREEYGE